MTALSLNDRTWPEAPYRGLNYFRPEDRPLLAGRNEDVLECTTLLAHPATRVLLLHGSTGCGKSSFLRAGLIPLMEEQGAGHLFLKVSDTDDEALFIRSTEAPVDQIARQVFLFASMPFELHTPRGVRTLDLTPALLNTDGWKAYLDIVRHGSQLLESLRRIAAIIPQTLVLIVDQAEEVLTLNPGEEDFLNRAQFFHFLREFQELEFDARIIVALRTEYFGRFIDAVQVSYRTGAEFRQFLLGELSPAALIEAVCRPTMRQEIFPFGVPYEVYGFEFEVGLPESIVSDILAARYSGPALPILQLVCLGLFEKAREGKSSLIAKVDYASEGGIQGLIIDHIRSAIRSGYVSESEFDLDIHRIREFLSSFYTMQDDGTVVARSRTIQWVAGRLQPMHLRIASDDLVACLTSSKTMILRALRAVSSSGQIIDEVTLGHDSVALALERWGARDAELRAQRIKDEKDAEINKINIAITDERTSYIRFLTGALEKSSGSIFTITGIASIGLPVILGIEYLWGNSDNVRLVVGMLTGRIRFSARDFIDALIHDTGPLVLSTVVAFEFVKRFVQSVETTRDVRVQVRKIEASLPTSRREAERGAAPMKSRKPVSKKRKG
jgi:conflict system STAND superfamily ATPase